ncbi:P-loop containing nucleoside triphosphate hydrolase protein [Gorgonomyces haynaldii]|nr:P-loop containing nucleoside triphosphate hydrolase protein [Gorgonomyces haynaldii]
MMQSGQCRKPNCEFSHTLITCKDCNIVCTNEKGYKQHLAGSRHRMTVGGQKEGIQCTTCRLYFVDQSSLQYHYKSIQHKKSLRVLQYEQSRADAHADKNGFSVVDGNKLELGVLDSPDPSKMHEVKIILKNIGGAGHVMTDYSRKPSDCVAFHTLQWSPIGSQKSVILLLRYQAIDYGYFQTEYRFIFHRDGAESVISRTVSLYVGDKDLYELLKPKAPYVKPPPVTGVVQQSDEIVPAGYIPELDNQTIKYVKKLDFYEVPKEMRQKMLIKKSAQSESPSTVYQANFVPKSFLSTTAYEKYYANLLWNEELRLEYDILRYSMKEVTLQQAQRKDILILKVPGLAESRPSIIKGDSILVKPSGSKGRAFEGRAIDIQLTEVYLRFSKEFFKQFIKGGKYDVQFKYNRIPWRRMQEALTRASFFTDFDKIFKSALVQKISRDAPELEEKIHQVPWRPFNRLTSDNPEQMRAIKTILSGVHRPLPLVIFGPPGTGKTVTLVEAMQQILEQVKDSRLLVCAPSNSAADVLLERLAKRVPKKDMIRLNAITRPMTADITNTVEEYSYRVRGSLNNFDIPPVSDLSKFRVIVSTCTTSSVLAAIGLPKAHFTHVFIDEAGQALEPEAMIPLNALEHGKDTVFVIAGDHKQLGPQVHSPVAAKMGLSVSILERLMAYSHSEDPGYPKHIAKWHNPRKQENDHQTYGAAGKIFAIKLLKNFRSHETILTVPNNLFYKGELIPSADPVSTHRFLGWQELTNPNVPMLFLHTIGKDEREAESPSWFNSVEIQQIVRVLESLRDNRSGFQAVTGDQVGIITPYNQQAKKIRTILKAKGYAGIDVGTVESFQGREKPVIIISTVRSTVDYLEHDAQFNLGFLRDPKRFNVAVTRAIGLLVVIGNGHILMRDPSWKAWLDDIHAKKCFKASPDFEEALLRTRPSVKEEDEESDSEPAVEQGWRQFE